MIAEKVKKTKREKRDAAVAKVVAGEFTADTYNYDDPLAQVHAYNWYAENLDTKTQVSYFLKYIENNIHYSQYLAQISNLPDWKFPAVACYIARMHTIGIHLEEKQFAWLEKTIEELIKNSSEKVKKVATGQVFRKRIDDAFTSQYNFLMEEIEIAIDNISKPFNAYDFLKKNNATPRVARAICDEMELRHKQISDSNFEFYWNDKEESELFLLNKFYKKIISDINLYCKNSKANGKPRKQRKIKEKPADTLTKGLKYLPESKEYRLVSINPEKILKSKKLWIFNVKTRQLGFYAALKDQTLAITGTSIRNYQEDASFTKRLRKPNEVLPAILGAPEGRSMKIFEDIKTDKTPIRSRISEDIILLKVV